MQEETTGAYLGYYFVLIGVVAGFFVSYKREETPSVEIPTGQENVQNFKDY